MISRRRRVLWLAAAGLAALGLGTMVTIWLLVATSAGARFVVARVVDRLPNAITIGEVQGTLWGPLDLRNVTVETDEAARTEIDRIHIEWSLWRLLRREVDISALTVDGVNVALPAPPATGTSSPPTLPNLQIPVRLTLRQALVGPVAIHRNDEEQPLVLDQLTASGLTLQQHLRVNTLGIRMPGVSIDLRGNLEPRNDYPVELLTTWSYRSPSAVQISGEGSITGTVQRLEVRQTVTEPFRAELEATVRDLLDVPRFQGAVTVSALEARHIDSTVTPLRLDAELETHGTADRFSTTGALRLVTDLVGALDARLEIERQEETWLIRQLRVRRGARPTELAIGGRVISEGGEPRVDLTTGWTHLVWPLDGSAVAESRRGGLTVSGTIDAYRFEMTGDLTAAGGPPSTWRVVGTGNRDGMNVRSIARMFGGEVRARGDITWTPDVRWRLAVDAEHVNPATVTTDSVRWTGDLAFHGTTSGHLTAEGVVGTVALRAIEGTLGGYPVSGMLSTRLDGQRALVDSVVVRAYDGAIRGSGRVTWSDGIGWQMAVEGRDLQPARLVPRPEEWEGALHLVATTAGAWDDRGAEARVEIERLTGRLRGQPLNGTAAIAVTPIGYSLPRVALEWGTAQLTASGEIGDSLSLTFDLSAPDIGLAVPRAAGGFTARGTVGGTRSAPTLRADVTGDGVSFGDHSIGRVTGQADLTLDPSGPFNLQLRAEELASGNRTMDSLVLQSRGTGARHEITGSIVSARGSLHLDARGALAEKTWTGIVSHMILRSPDAGEWTLGEEAALTAGPLSARLNPACWVSGEARVCGEGEWTRDGEWRMLASLERLSLSSFRQLVPAGWQVTGLMHGTIAATAQPGGGLVGNLDLEAGPGILSYEVTEGGEQLSYDRAFISARAGDDGVHVNLATTVRHADTLQHADPRAFAVVSGEARLPAYRGFGASWRAEPIVGRLQATFSDLSIVEAAYPQLTRTGGALEVDVRLSGTLDSVRLLGSVELRDAHADIPEFGLSIQDIAFTARGLESGDMELSGRARSGGGVLTLTGRSGLAPTTASPLRASVRGSRVQVMATPQIQGWISPVLDITVAGRRVDVGGELRVDRATIQLREVPDNALQISPDVVFVGDTAASTPSLWNVHSRIRLDLGDSISFQGLGFTGRPIGNILAVDEPGQPTLGTGQILIREGRYRAYGQDLSIDSGRVFFGGGPIDNPGLDIRAYRRARDGVLAGLELRGTLRSPVTTVFSEPPMTQGEALAYVVFGRPLNEATASEGDQLTRAAASLGLRGGNLLAKRLAGRFGLDDARIESEGDLREAALVAGKYLSPKLYVSYGIGLFDRASTWRARYLLTSKWTLQAETGETTGADLFYRIERGR